MHRRTLEPYWAARFARLALDCLGREYPNHPLTLLVGDEDVLPPREHTPAFFGCFDWHSAVHGHWTLVRLLQCLPEESWSDEARHALQRSLTQEHLSAEVRHLAKPGREGFERPYGLAWLLQLASELRRWDAPDAVAMVAAIAALEALCRDRLAEWLPKLTHPIRSGEHSQTAFAMGLSLDWALATGDHGFATLLHETALRFYGDDVDLPTRLEPSGHDFLSPSLAESDLMRRVLSCPDNPRSDFANWLERALPQIGESGSFAPVISSDRADGKLAHLDGLNLSRAWMLDGIVSVLPEDDPRHAAFERQADAHAEAGLASVTGEHYAGGHWLGTFATYLMTGRGLPT